MPGVPLVPATCRQQASLAYFLRSSVGVHVAASALGVVIWHMAGSSGELAVAPVSSIPSMTLLDLMCPFLLSLGGGLTNLTGTVSSTGVQYSPVLGSRHNESAP